MRNGWEALALLLIAVFNLGLAAATTACFQHHDVLHDESPFASSCNGQSRRRRIELQYWKTTTSPRRTFTSSLQLQLASSSSKTQRLTFTANVVATSDPLPAASAVDFFGSPLFFLKTCSSSGGTVEPCTAAQRQLWIDACNDYYGDDHLPIGNNNKCFVLVAPSTIQFPGLTVENTILNGIQLIEPDSNNTNKTQQLPIYKGILLAERRRVFGAPLAVWLFHQLTGGSNAAAKDDDTDVFLPSTSCQAVSTISLLPLTDVNDDCEGSGQQQYYCVRTDSSVSVFFEFPRLLTRLVPMSVSQMETVGSAAVQKAVTTDIWNAVGRTEVTFTEWQQHAQAQATTTAATTATPTAMVVP